MGHRISGDTAGIIGAGFKTGDWGGLQQNDSGECYGTPSPPLWRYALQLVSLHFLAGVIVRLNEMKHTHSGTFDVCFAFFRVPVAFTYRSTCPDV